MAVTNEHDQEQRKGGKGLFQLLVRMRWILRQVRAETSSKFRGGELIAGSITGLYLVHFLMRPVASYLG